MKSILRNVLLLLTSLTLLFAVPSTIYFVVTNSGAGVILTIVSFILACALALEYSELERTNNN